VARKCQLLLKGDGDALQHRGFTCCVLLLMGFWQKTKKEARL
jgi:hypothetical protein